MADYYYQDDYVKIIHGDCREILPTLDKVDLVCTDPPYGKVKGDFDDAWTNRPAMLKSCEEWLQAIVGVMKSNATLYWFAWPSLAGRIESLIAEKLNPLAHILWKKPNPFAQKHSPGNLRAPAPETERILMAEHYGADSIALGESGYQAECDKARGMVFEPLRSYLDSERKRCGITNEQIMDGMEAKGMGRYMFARHSFSTSQWCLPTVEQYMAAREVFDEHAKSGEFLRKDYEELRKDYEELRRYFELDQRDPKTEIWTFHPEVHNLNHPTVKPLSLMSFMVRISCRIGGVVCDPFMGSGTTLRAAKDLQRQAIGIELEERYCEIAAKRMSQEVLPLEFAE